MSRYIDLDSEDCVWCGNPGEYENWNIPLDMPGVDVAPVVHGHWIDKFAGEYRCSSCREKVCIDNGVEFPNGIRYEYCPWCGAKMDEVTE